MKQKEIVLRASRFSLIMAFVLGTLFGLNSCRDEFNDEDALRAELEALATARAAADEAARQRMRDSLNLVLIAQAQAAQTAAETAEAQREWLAYKDSLAAISGLFNLQVNVVYGNTATSAGDRTTGTANVDDAQVTVQQILRSAGTGEVFSTVNTFDVTNGLVVIPDLVTGEVALTVTQGDFTTAKVQVLLDAPARDASCNCDEGFTPPTYNAALQVPIWKLPTGSDPTNEFATVEGELTIEQDLTNFTREAVADAVVTAVIDGDDSFFNQFTGKRETVHASGTVLNGEAVADVQRITYESSIFAGTVTSGNYSIVLPGTGIDNGVPYRLQFGEIALDQRVIARVGDGDADFTAEEVRATFGPGMIYDAVPNADAVAPKVTIPGPAAGEGVGALATAEILAGSGEVQEIRFDGALGMYSQAPVLYIASSSDGTESTPVHPDYALPTDATGTLSVTNGVMDASATITQGGQLYNGTDQYAVEVKPYELAVMNKAAVENDAFDVANQSYFTLATTVEGGSVTGITLNGGGTGVNWTPVVVIAAPASGTQAEATASVSGGEISITVTNPGSGYTSAPAVSLYRDAAASMAYVQTDDASIDLTIESDASLPWDPQGNFYGLDLGTGVDDSMQDPTTANDVNKNRWQISDGRELLVGVADESLASGGSVLPAYLTDDQNAIVATDGSSRAMDADLGATPTKIDYPYYRGDNPEGDDFTQMPTVHFYTYQNLNDFSDAVDGTSTKSYIARSGGKATYAERESTFPTVTASGPVVAGPHETSLNEVEKVTVSSVGDVSVPFSDLRMEFVSSVEEYAEVAAIFEVNVKGNEFVFADARSNYVLDPAALTTPFTGVTATVDVTAGPAAKDDISTLADPVTGTAAGTIGLKAGSIVTQGSPLYDANSATADDAATLFNEKWADRTATPVNEGFGYVGNETVTATGSISGSSTNFTLNMGDGYVFSAALNAGTGATNTSTEAQPGAGGANPDTTTVTFLVLDKEGTVNTEGEESIMYDADASASVTDTQSGIWRGGVATGQRVSGGSSVQESTSLLSRVYIRDGGSYSAPPTTPEPSNDGKTYFKASAPNGAVVQYAMSFDQLDDFALSTSSTANFGSNIPSGTIMIDANKVKGSYTVTNGKIDSDGVPALIRVTTDAANNNVVSGIQEVVFRGFGYNEDDNANANFQVATFTQIEAVVNHLKELDDYMPNQTTPWTFDPVLMGGADYNVKILGGTTSSGANETGIFADYLTGDLQNFDAQGVPFNDLVADAYDVSFFAEGAGDVATDVNIAITGITGANSIDASWTGIEVISLTADDAAITTALQGVFNPAAGSYAGIFAIDEATVKTAYPTSLGAAASGISATDRTLAFDEIDDSWDTKYSSRLTPTAPVTAQDVTDAMVRALANPFATSATAFSESLDGTTITIGNDATANGIATVDASWNTVAGYVIDPTDATTIAELAVAFVDVNSYGDRFAFSVEDLGNANAAVAAEIVVQANVAIEGTTWDDQFALLSDFTADVTAANITNFVDRLQAAYDPAQDYRTESAVGANNALSSLLNDAYYFSGGSATVTAGETLVMSINPFVAAGAAASDWNNAYGVLTASNFDDIDDVLTVESIVEAAFTTPAGGGNAAIRVVWTDGVTGGYDIATAAASLPTNFRTSEITGRIDRWYKIESEGTEGALTYDFGAADATVNGNTVPSSHVIILPNDGSGAVDRDYEAELVAVPKFTNSAGGSSLINNNLTLVASGNGYTGSQANDGTIDTTPSNVVLVERLGTADYVITAGTVNIAREILSITYNGQDGDANDEDGDELFEGAITVTIAAPTLASVDAVRAVQADVTGIFTCDGTRITSVTLEHSGLAYPHYVYNWVTNDASNDGSAGTPIGSPSNFDLDIEGATNGFSLGSAVTDAAITLDEVPTSILDGTTELIGSTTGTNFDDLLENSKKMFDLVLLDDGGKGYQASPLLEIMNGTDKLMGSAIGTFAVTDGVLSVASVPSRGVVFTSVPNALFSRDFRLMSWFGASRIDMEDLNGQIRNIIVRNKGTKYPGTAGEVAPVGITITGGGIDGAAPTRPAVVQAKFDGTGGLTFEIVDRGIGYREVPSVSINTYTTAPGAATAAVGNVTYRVTGVTVAQTLIDRLDGFTSAPYLYIREIDPAMTATNWDADLFGLQYVATDRKLNEIALAEVAIDGGKVSGVTVTQEASYASLSNLRVYLTTIKNNGHQWGNVTPSANTPQEYVARLTSDASTDVLFKTGEGTVDKSSVFVYHGGGFYDNSAPTYAVFLPETFPNDLSTSEEIYAGAEWIRNHWISEGHEPAIAIATIDEASGTVTGVSEQGFVLNGTGYVDDEVEVVFLNHRNFSILANLIDDLTLGGELSGTPADEAAAKAAFDARWAKATPANAKAKVSSDGVITEITWDAGTGFYYVTAPSVTVSALIGSGATATSTITDGVLSGITVTDGGSNYARNIPSVEYFSFGGASTVGGSPLAPTMAPLSLHLLSGQKLVRDAYYGTGLRADAND